MKKEKINFIKYMYMYSIYLKCPPTRAMTAISAVCDDDRQPSGTLILSPYSSQSISCGLSPWTKNNFFPAI